MMTKLFLISLILALSMSCGPTRITTNDDNDGDIKDHSEKNDYEFKKLASFFRAKFISDDASTVAQASGLVFERQMPDFEYVVDNINYEIKVLNRDGKELHKIKNIRNGVDHLVMNDEKSKLFFFGRSFTGCDLVSYDLKQNRSKVLKSYPNERNCARSSFIKNGNFLVLKPKNSKDVDIVNIRNEIVTTKTFAKHFVQDFSILSMDINGKKAIFLTRKNGENIAVICDLLQETPIRSVTLPTDGPFHDQIILGASGDHYYIYHRSTIEQRNVATGKLEQKFKTDHPFGHGRFIDFTVSPDEKYILAQIAYRPTGGGGGLIEDVQERVVLFDVSSAKELMKVKLNRLSNELHSLKIKFLSNKIFALFSTSIAEIFELKRP